MTLKADGVRKYLRVAGMLQLSDSVWRRELEGLFERVLMVLYWEGSEVSRVLGERLLNENVQ
ncbi:hypothetical protein A1OS_15095 [Enterovibrio norvegicus]|nr:hypothetical protein A1OS_15095 [Enterovibrio norvegicus]